MNESDPNEDLLLLVTCYLKQLLHMNLAHNRLISESQMSDSKDQLVYSRTVISYFKSDSFADTEFNQQSSPGTSPSSSVNPRSCSM